MATKKRFEYAPAPESRAIVDLRSSYGLFINGEFVDGNGHAFKSVSPATEEVLAELGYTVSQVEKLREQKVIR